MNENPQAESNRPGGGLGAPIDAPDPLEKYRWPIIGAFVVLLAIGGWIVTKRQGAVSAAAMGSAGGAGASGPRATFASGPLVAPITGPGAGAITGSGVGSNTGSSVGLNTGSLSGDAAATQASAVTSAGASKSSAIMEALKEELFHLELDRKQGRVSAEEYDKAKAALDQTLDRALKRQG
jgi:hypothetical protein